MINLIKVFLDNFIRLLILIINYFHLLNMYIYTNKFCLFQYHCILKRNSTPLKNILKNNKNLTINCTLCDLIEKLNFI